MSYSPSPSFVGARPGLAETQWSDDLSKVVELLFGRVSIDEKDLGALEQIETSTQLTLTRTSDPEIVAGSKHILAMIAVARGEFPRAFELFSESYEAFPMLVTLQNEMVAKIGAGEWPDACRLMDTLAAQCPGDSDVLAHLYTQYLTIGQFARAFETATKLTMLGRQDEAAKDEWFQKIGSWLQRIESDSGYGDAQSAYHERWKVAATVIHGVGLKLHGAGISVQPDSSAAVQLLCMDADPRRLAEADWAIADAMVDSFAEPLDQFFTFSTISDHGR